MKTQLLKEGWELVHEGGERLSTHVPFSVYNDLLTHGKIEDPFWRDNENTALPLMEKDYQYELHFDADPEIMGCEKILLHCDGLDTLADLTLNGTPIGHAYNMHRVWEFDLTGTIQEKGNVLQVVFHSPTKYIKEQEQEKGYIPGSEDAMRGFPYLRKAHCMFGWDWGPRLPDMGIWRDISLLGVEKARFTHVAVRQKHENGKVKLTFLLDYTGSDVYVRISITAPNGNCIEYDAPQEVTIDQPQLWWPNGYGEQPLYTVRIVLASGGHKEDIWERRIGLRTLTIRRVKDEYGESFAQECNGVPFFAMGADYIPEDNLLPRVTKARTRDLLEQCAYANFNVIRIWGGGYFPNDFFYDICDELGLVIWQDMLFACALYPFDREFADNLRAEITDNVERIRHHACLGLWCGNNEMEGMIVENWEPVTKQQMGDYTRLYSYFIPKLLHELDPDTFYWPSSPSSGGDFDDPQDPNRGDVHYWQVWHGNKPFPDYRNYFFRYVSEFGFQSFPAMKTIESFTLPEDRNIFSYVMEKHQRNNAANGKIMNYLAQTFLYPTRFDTLVYASQLLQAEAIRYGVEHWRRNRGRCMGAIVWQLNDCWPVASWASIDYFGRWKALHYYEKRFFAPVLLSCCEEGILTQDTDTNAEPYDVKKSIRLNVANETMTDQTVTVRWTLRDNRSNIRMDGGEQTVTVSKLSSHWFDEVLLPQADLFGDYVAYECLQDGQVISEGTVLFAPPKHFHFVDPELSVRVERKTLVITAKAYARGVELLNENEDWVLSDNYFDMNAGEKRIRILAGVPEGIHVRSVYDIR